MKANPSIGAGIRRGFVDLPWGQIHFRRCGASGRRPLVMLHSNPGSSAMLAELMLAMGRTRPVLAPDTTGLGDSSPLPAEQPEIPDYARAALEWADALGLEEYDLYGTHTGANMAVEMAIARPGQVRHLMLDGIALYTPELRRDLLARYARPMPPSSDGAHLLQAWHFVRDQWIFWPWFRRDAAHRRTVDLATPEFLHEIVLDVLKAATTYQRAYRASFAYGKEERLPLLRVPTLLSSPATDIFFPELERIAAIIPGCRRAVLPAGTVASAAETFARFLDEA